MSDATDALVNEIKVLLQGEFLELRASIHKMEVQMTEMRGSGFTRREFERAMEIERRKDDERAAEVQLLKTEVATLKSNLAIYLGIAATATGVVASVVTALIIAAVT